MDVAAGSEKWSKFKDFFLRLEKVNYFGSKNKSDCMRKRPYCLLYNPNNQISSPSF